MNNIKRHREGFTLVELMMTIAILSILVFCAVNSYDWFQKKIQQAEGRQFAQFLLSEQTKYFARNQSFAPNALALGMSSPLKSTPPYYVATIRQCGGQSFSQCAEIFFQPNSSYKNVGNTLEITANTRGLWNEVE